MAYNVPSTATPLPTMRVTGIEEDNLGYEKDPHWLTDNKPNCYACKENYANRPLFSRCDECIGMFEGLELTAEEAIEFRERTRDLPELIRDPIGGLVLPHITTL